MGKLPPLPHVKYVRSKGRIYAYFNTGQMHNGRPIRKRLPSPDAPGFYDSYAAFCAGRNRRAVQAYDFAALVRDYLGSAEYRSKAVATQKLYALQLQKAVERLGKFGIDAIKPAHLHTILDGEGWGAATQNIFVASIGAVYLWGRRRSKTTNNPTQSIPKIKTGQHEPWPENVLEAALVAHDDITRLAVHLLYFTGQRLGDVCNMRWNDLRGDLLTITQKKTGKLVEIPIASELRAEIDRTPMAGLTILATKAGQPVKPARLRERLQRFTESRGAKTVPHGLRKNAVIALLEFECTIAEVAAITGQTHAMVEHYAARVNRRRLGASAILKFDAGRNVNRKTIGKLP